MGALRIGVNSSLLARIDQSGYAVLEHILEQAEIEQLSDDLGSAASENLLHRNGEAYAIRNLTDIPAIRVLCKDRRITTIVNQVLGPEHKAVRAILFDKVAGSNWVVPFHQDLTITVKERCDVDGFGPWTQKAGAICVQPPAWVMEGIISVRIHLDDCDGNNGALRVIRGSHRMGRLTAAKIAKLRAQLQEDLCELKAGGVLIMRPHLLHASSRAIAPCHRRVIHVDFTSVALPGGLEWRDAI